MVAAGAFIAGLVLVIGVVMLVTAAAARDDCRTAR